MALSATPYESVWNTATTPKDVVVAGCALGDWLAIIAGGDQSTSNGVTAATTTIQAGPGTGTVTELVEDFDSGTNVDWYHASKIEVTGAGDITVRVDRTKAGGASGEWGFLVLRGRGCSGVNLAGQLGTAGSTEVISCTVTQGSTIVFGSFDWTPAAPPVVWTPGGQTVIESSTIPTSVYTVAAAFWENQPAGTQNYGTTDSASTVIKAVALELVEAAASPQEGPGNSNAMHLMGKSYY